MSEQFDAEGADQDRTRLIWAAIGVAFVLMVVMLWFMGLPDPNATQVRARHILLKYDTTDPVARQRALDTITDLRKRIQEGSDFATLAKEYSDDPGSNTRGGDLGFRDPTDFDSSFKDYVMTAPVGQISDIVSTSHGFHVIQVVERRLSEYDRREQELERRIREGEDPPPDL